MASKQEEAKEKQRQRSEQYGIEIRENGHVSKPSEYANVPDSEFLDPVNYAYPVDTRAHALAAVRYWGVQANRDKYSHKSQQIIDDRIESASRKYRIGEFNKGQILKVYDDQQIAWGIFLEPGSPDNRDLQGQWASAEEIEKAAHTFMIEYQASTEMHNEPADAVLIESAIAPVDMIVEKEVIYKGTWYGAFKVYSTELWNKIRSGKYTGFSIGGTATIIADEV